MMVGELKQVGPDSYIRSWKFRPGFDQLRSRRFAFNWRDYHQKNSRMMAPTTRPRFAVRSWLWSRLVEREQLKMRSCKKMGRGHLSVDFEKINDARMKSMTYLGIHQRVR